MNEITIAVPNEEPSIIATAKEGLYSELSELSVKMYSRAIDDFLVFAEDRGGEAFGGSFAVAFSKWLHSLKEAGLSASTVRNKQAQVRRFFEWLARVNGISQQEYLSIKGVKTPKVLGGKAGRWLNEEQLKALLNAPDTSTEVGRRDKAVLALLIGCALRRGDVCNLKWGNLSQYGETYVITNLHRKHGRVQDFIPMPDSVMKAILEFSPRGKDDESVIKSFTKNYRSLRDGITTDTIWRIVRGYCDWLGFGVIAPHDLRRSSARYYKTVKDVSLDQLRMVMGHESVATTQKYVNELMQIEEIANSYDLE